MGRKAGSKNKSVKIQKTEVTKKEETPIVMKTHVPKITPKRTTVHIANTTMGKMMFPRSGRSALKTVPLVLPPGMSVPVEADEWQDIKRRNKGARDYMALGHLREINKDGSVNSQPFTANLVIPETLRYDNEAEGSSGIGGISAKVTNQTLTHIEI